MNHTKKYETTDQPDGYYIQATEKDVIATLIAKERLQKQSSPITLKPHYALCLLVIAVLSVYSLFTA